MSVLTDCSPGPDSHNGLNTGYCLRLQATAFMDETRAIEIRHSLIATNDPVMVSL